MSGNENVLDDLVYQRVVSLSKYGDKLAKSARYDEAIEKYKEALQMLPSPYENWEAANWIYVAIGDARFKQGYFEKSLKSFVNSTHCPSGTVNPFIHLRLGQCEFELGNRERAANDLEKAYIDAGNEIFLEDDIKYLNFIKARLSD